MTKEKVFSVRESRYYRGCKEVWKVYPRETLNYDDGKYGYFMTCTVFDLNGNELFSDHGETYEIHLNAARNIADYKSLEADLIKTLKSLGLKKNITKKF